MTGQTIQVLAIPGSLRRESYNRSLLRAAATLTPPGMSLTVYESLDTIPMFSEDLEHPAPPGVVRLRREVAASDGVLIATPEYNQSLPGVVKNVIDWLSRSAGSGGLAGKPVAITGVTTGPWGTRLAQTQVRQVLTATQALVLPHPTLFLRSAQTLFDSDRRLVDEPTREMLRDLLVSFDDWIQLVSLRGGHRLTSGPLIR